MPTADEVATAVIDRLNREGTAFGLTTFGQTNVEAVNLGRAAVNTLARLEKALGDLNVLDPIDEQAIAAAVLAELTPETIAAAIPADLADKVADELAQRLAG